MKLQRIEIRNFRSIKNCNIEIEKNFQILVGINESGKSNILKAASFLNGDIKFSVNDIRDPGHDEGTVENSSISFILKINNELFETLYESLISKILSDDFSTPLIQVDNAHLSLREFIVHKDKMPYIVNLTTQSRYLGYYLLSKDNCHVFREWKKIKSDTHFNIERGDSTIDIHSYAIVNTRSFKGVPDELLEDLDVEYLNKLVGEEIIRLGKKHLPNCIVWQYKDENLLPDKIHLDNFISDQNSCIPLKNMFVLSGYANAGKALEEAKAKTNGLRNILRRVSENTTNHMKNVWPDWKNQKVVLTPNGAYVEAGIEDEYNVYSLERRSDGFKRFFTFMLMISVKNKTRSIINNLIIIDEPEAGLHPSGIKYIREELKKISHNNIVIASTHSIFMIDKEIVERHILVKKTKEVTEIERVNGGNITDEEVIYNALGFSLFELLKSKNIIFEGWRDKKIFEKYIDNCAAHSTENSAVGYLHCTGVKDIPRVANMCENFSRKYLVLSDSDKPAKEKQKDFAGTGKWVCYDDVANVNAKTTEDFISNDLLNRAIKSSLIKHNFNNEILVKDSLEIDKLKWIHDEISKLPSLEKDQIRKIMNDIKEFACLNLEAADISENYSKVVDYLFQQL